MLSSFRYWTLVALAAVGAPFALIGTSRASDHADTPEIAANPGTDITDVYVFPANTFNRAVLVMNVHPLITPGQVNNVAFDPNVLYQIKIDNTGDAVEDLVVQAKFTGNGPNQTVRISTPLVPSTFGTRNVFEPTSVATSTLNTKFQPTENMWAYAGVREDPFFFDLERFFEILPDRATPITGMPAPDPNMPQKLNWRPQGEAVDFLSNGRYNVLTIAVEVPRNWIKGSGNGKIGVWATTSVEAGDRYKQMDRLARPVVNEVLATVAYDRHKINDEAAPSEDAEELKYDILNFMTYPAHRSAATREALASVLVPDMLMADLNQSGKAAYLGVETGGATGGKFGGRALTDDVVDISLGAVFGTTLSDLGLVPPDGREIPSLYSDHVGPEGKRFKDGFPYLGQPRL